MSFRKYASYKDSGIAWLGKIPAHWTVTFIKRRYEITLGKMLKSNQTEPDETEAPYLRTVNIHWRGIDTSDVKRMWFTDYEKQKLELCKDDLLVCEGGDVGRSALWNDEIEDCYIQNSINRIRAREDADTRFLFYWLYFIKHIGYIDMICNKATIAHFTVEKVGATPCAYPSLEEQQKIAAFLDKETVQIDALIDEQTRLISLLREKRQAVISNAVTKGLNPNANLKDSGIEWIGKVPAHWEVKKLKYVCSRSGLYGANVAATHYQETGVRFLRTTDITDDGQIKKDGVFLPEELVRDYILNDGDILLSRSGTVGRSLLYQSKLHGPCSYAGYLVRFVPNPHTLPKYVFFFTKTHAFERFLRLMAISATIENVNADKYANVHLPAPPGEEQEEIADYLDRETKQIDALIEECEMAIGLLKERRTALISAAVTGAIDVRNVG